MAHHTAFRNSHGWRRASRRTAGKEVLQVLSVAPGRVKDTLIKIVRITDIDAAIRRQREAVTTAGIVLARDHHFQSSAALSIELTTRLAVSVERFNQLET